MKKYIATIIIVFILLSVCPVITVAQAAETGGSPLLTAQGAILMEVNTGKVLYGKNPDEKVYPASTTKILTAMLAIELGNLEDMVTVGEEVKMIPWDSSKAGLYPGETLTLEHLIYGLLLRSGNDAANTMAVYIARKVGGKDLSISEALAFFSSLMNARAKQAGAVNSNFVNAHGYHDPDHYTTPRDMGLITLEALRLDFFRKAIATTSVKSGVLENGNPRYWVNTNKLIQESNREYYEYATGVKTGFTEEAGNCLVASATKDGMELISVVMKCAYNDQWSESRALLEYGFNNFVRLELFKKGTIVETLPVDDYAADDWGSLALEITGESTEVVVSKAELAGIERILEWDEDLLSEDAGVLPRLKAPIKKGQVVGRVKYMLSGELLAQSPLAAARDVKALEQVEPPDTSDGKSLINYLVMAACIISAYMLYRMTVARIRRKRRRYYYLYR